MSDELDIDAVEEAARKRRFHEHVTILCIDLERAYQSAGRALTRIRIDDDVRREVLTSYMSKLSEMSARANRMRDMEG